MKYHRYLEADINSICFKANKMAFISGPRQCGKTTMAKLLLKDRGFGEYYNWDEIKFRRLWTKDPQSILPTTSGKEKPLIILDELHKAKSWKRSVKGLYDSEGDNYDLLVTGSARLNIYRKGSDSLMGRYYHFKLHPFSLAEMMAKNDLILPEDLITKIFSGAQSHSKEVEKAFQLLYQFGPFPEPLFAANEKTLNLWQRNRIEKIIREDLRDLSRLPELSQVEMLASLLPERVGQPLSIQSLKEDLEVAYTTIKRWLNYLCELYYFYTIKPYSKSLKRAIKKEPKAYLWDWSEVANEGARFENMIASHLLKYCDYLTDTGVGKFELAYLKDKSGHEIDFIIVKNGKPFLPIEVKKNQEFPSDSWKKLITQTSCKHGLQLVMTPNVYKLFENPDYKILTVSAAHFLQMLV